MDEQEAIETKTSEDADKKSSKPNEQAEDAIREADDENESNEKQKKSRKKRKSTKSKRNPEKQEFDATIPDRTDEAKEGEDATVEKKRKKKRKRRKSGHVPDIEVDMTSEGEVFGDQGSEDEFGEEEVEEEEEPPPEMTNELRKAMHDAVAEGDLDLLEDLMDDPAADINAIWFGETLLMTAIRNTHQLLAEFLIDNGCDINFEAPRVVKEGEEEEPQNEKQKSETAPETHYKHYTVVARQMAYDAEMHNIVYLIDYINGCLFPTITWPLTRDPVPRRTMEERGKKPPTPEMEEAESDSEFELDECEVTSEDFAGKADDDLSDAEDVTTSQLSPRAAHRVTPVSPSTFTAASGKRSRSRNLSASQSTIVRPVEPIQKPIPPPPPPPPRVIQTKSSLRRATLNKPDERNSYRFRPVRLSDLTSALGNQGNKKHVRFSGAVHKPASEDTSKVRFMSPYSDDLSFNSVRASSRTGDDHTQVLSRRTSKLQHLITKAEVERQSEELFVTRKLLSSDPPRTPSRNRVLSSTRRSVTSASSQRDAPLLGRRAASGVYRFSPWTQSHPSLGMARSYTDLSITGSSSGRSRSPLFHPPSASRGKSISITSLSSAVSSPPKKIKSALRKQSATSSDFHVRFLGTSVLN